MKTPKEIKKGLECCTKPLCAECPYDSEPSCVVKNEDALAYIQQLEEKLKLEQEAKKSTLKVACDCSINWTVERLPKWISVEERLPETRDWVLIIGEWVPEGGWIVPHIAEYRDGVWITNGTGWNKIEDLRVKVTHWMPLPEPPEV